MQSDLLTNWLLTVRNVIAAISILLVFLIGTEPLSAAPRASSNSPTANSCNPAKSAAVRREAISLAEKVKVTIVKSEQLRPLQTFEVHVELTDPSFETKNASVTIGLSDNARFESNR